MRQRLARTFFAIVCMAGAMATPHLRAQDTNDGGENGKAAVPLREQTIYVPYSKLRDSFEKEGRGVFLPYAEFQKLWKAARGNRARPVNGKPPVAALITEVASTATVAKDVIDVDAQVTIDVLQEGWHRVPIRLADAAIREATLAGQPARIVPNPGGGYALLVKKEGKHAERMTLALKYSKAFTKTPGQNSVSLQAPQAPVNRWQIHIPQAGVKVRVHPMIAASELPDDAAKETTVVQAFVGAAPTVRIDWTPKSEGAAGLAALATVQAQQQSSIDEGVLRTRAQLAFEITRADLSQLRIEVPADQKVAGVFDPNVRQWEVAKKGDVQTITVQLFQPTRGRQNVTVELEQFSGDWTGEAVRIPTIKALDVARQQGVVVVGLAQGLRGSATERTGLLQMDASELPQALAKGKWAFAYRYATLPFDLRLAVEKVQPQIRVDQLVEATLEPEQWTVDLFVIFDIQRAGVFQVKLDVPKDFELRHVRGREGCGAQAAAVDTYRRQGKDKTELLVNLSRKALGKVGLWVELVRRLDDPNLLTPTGKASEIALPLPRVDEADVEQTTGRLVIYKPESLRVRPDKQEGVRSISFAEALQPIPSTRDGRFPQTRPALAFAYTGDDVDLKLNVERRKPHLTSRQLLVARVEAGQIKYEATFFTTIRYSGVKSLRIDVPADLAADIRNDTPGLREATIEPAPDDVAEGDVAWSFTGETELLGDVVIRLAWEQKMDALEIGKPIQLPVPRLQARDVDSAWGQIVVTKSETIDVRPSGSPQGLRPIDPQHDMRAKDRIANAARAFEFHEDWSLTLEATRYQLEEVKRTSIELAVVRQVVTRGDQIAVQALYRMRSARQRLAVRLPGKVDFDAQPLRIAGTPTPLERGDGDQLFIPLVGQHPDRAFLLELRYTIPGTAADLQLPVFGSDKTGRSGPAVQKVILCAYLPDDLALLGARGPWTDLQRPWWQRLTRGPGAVPNSDARAIAQVMEGVPVAGDPTKSFPTDGTLYLFSTLRPESGAAGALSLKTMNANGFQALTFALVLLFGMGLLVRPVREKFTALAALVIALILAGVFLPTLSQQILSGVLFWALSIVLIVWVVWFVVRDLPQLRPARARKRREPIVASPAAPRADDEAPDDPSPDDASRDAPSPDDMPSDEKEGDDHA